MEREEWFLKGITKIFLIVFKFKKGWAKYEEVKSKYVYCTGKDFLWLIFNNLVKKIIF